VRPSPLCPRPKFIAVEERDGRHGLGNAESGRLMVLPKEKTMNNRRVDPKSGVIELNDEQLKNPLRAVARQVVTVVLIL
jgi:hypothetical protein